MNKYTKKLREEMVEKIVDYMQSKGYPPSVEDVRKMIGLRSKSSVYHHLQMMREDGMIDFTDGIPRSIRVPGVYYNDMRK